MYATRPQALLVDLDDTLLDISGIGAAIEATCRAIASKAPTVSIEKLRQANALVWEQYWPDVESDWMLGRLSGADLTLEAWRRTLAACGADESAEYAASLYRRLDRQSYRLYPDAVELLRVVKQQQLPTALVTNGASDSQRGKLDALGLEGVFDAVVVSGEIGAAKPDVAPFRVALRTLGMDGDNVWHVGDSLASDVAGANAAGLASVWLNRHGRERPVGAPNPAVEIRSLTEIADTLTDTR